MKRAQRRRFHYIYKITNKLNGKFYIGMHSTDNLDDGYFGSGKYLSNSIGKHGKENHEMEILEHYFSREDLANREKELVNQQTIQDPACMNIKVGGDGGWDHIRHDIDFLQSQARLMTDTWLEKMKDPDFYEHFCASVKIAHNDPALRVQMTVSRTSNGRNYNECWIGRKHSDETKQKLRKSKNTGEANSQFGTCWINNGTEAKKVKKETLQIWLNDGWQIGRKVQI